MAYLAARIIYVLRILTPSQSSQISCVQLLKLLLWCRTGLTQFLYELSMEVLGKRLRYTHARRLSEFIQPLL